MELVASGEPESLNLSARALHASTVKTVRSDESVPFFFSSPLFFLFFFLMTSMQLVHPLECAEGWQRNEDTHVYVSDAEERCSCYKYSSAVFLLTFQFYNLFQKIWTKIL